MAKKKTEEKINQNKKGGEYHGRMLRNREHEILFMDLRTWTENPVKGENKKNPPDHRADRAGGGYLSHLAERGNRRNAL